MTKLTPSTTTPERSVIIIDGTEEVRFSYPDGSYVQVADGYSLTSSSISFGNDCTLVLGEMSSFTIKSKSTCSFGDNCTILLNPGSKFTVNGGANINAGSNLTVDIEGDFVLGAMLPTTAQNGDVSISDYSTIRIKSGGNLRLLSTSSLSLGKGCVLDCQEGDMYLATTGSTVQLGQESCIMLSERHPVTGSGVIKGPDFEPKKTVQKYARFQAPIALVLDGVSAEGNWHLDCAYPQWFAPADCDDWSDAIQKAITMKKTGVVFLQRGLYPIKKSIRVAYGIELVGEAGVRGYDYTNWQYEDYNGTIIAAVLTDKNDQANGWKHFSFGCMVLVNISPAKIPSYADNALLDGTKKEMWDKAYPSIATSIRNMMILNGDALVTGSTLSSNPTLVPRLSGVFVAGGCLFERVYFGAFRQAIVRSGDYSDNMRIIECTFSKGYEFNYDGAESYNKYMVELPGSGDNLLFRGNGFHGGGLYNKALYISTCRGGTIADNIINAQVFFKGCRALTFSNNHMEASQDGFYGPKVTVIDSQMTIRDNFFYKSNVNNLEIRGSSYGEMCVVNLFNNTFYCRFWDIPQSQIRIADLASDATANDASTPNTYDEIVSFWKSRSEVAEICINPGTELHIKDSYRQLNGVNSRTWPSSVAVAFKFVGGKGDDIEPDETEWLAKNALFNNLSQYLSSESCIKPGFHIENLIDTQSDTNVTVTDAIVNKNTNWYALSGYYDYYAQVVFDEERLIVGTVNGSTLAHISSDIQQHKGYRECVLAGLNPANESKGAYIRMYQSNQLTVGWSARLHVYRSRRDTPDGVIKEWEKVVIPVSGVTMLYDNGITLSGYAWKALTDASEANGITNGNFGIKAVTHRNANVECLSTQNPSTLKGKWTLGDVVYNVGADDSWTVFVKK